VVVVVGSKNGTYPSSASWKSNTASLRRGRLFGAGESVSYEKGK
jgi:hypothetical protein